MDLVPIPPVADELAARFAAAGHRLYLVGGSVRDALLGRPADDLDFTTDARPPAVLALLEGWADAVWDTGIAFGTVGARRHGTTVEITTFRADAYDRVTRNPVVAFGDTIEDDLVRRDFTVNAMAVELTGADEHRRFVDPHGGLAALAAGMLDTPATPEESFADDPLRMLRAARFVSQLGLTPAPRVRRGDDGDGGRAGPDHQGAGAGRADQAGPRARTRGAGSSCWSTPGWPSTCCPRCPAMRLAIDEHMQHKDVYTHSLVVLEQAIDRETDGPDLVLRLAALLHDIGKPATRRKEPDGRVSFHHHEVVGAKLMRRRLRDAALPEGRRSTRCRSWCSCTCASTATAPASGPTRRCAAT